MISLIVGGLIPMFCTFTPGASQISSMIASFASKGKQFADMTKKAAWEANKAKAVKGRASGIIGSGIGSTVALTQSSVVQQLNKKTAMAAADSPV
jgi:hypothetical protein